MFSNLSKPAENLPATGFVAVSQAVFGCGLGLLIAGRLRRSVQRNTALALLSVGLLSTVPLLYEVWSKRWNRPESDRSMRKRLESIRQDSGLSTDVEIY